MKISYECSDLIEELKKDVKEFGEDKELYAFYQEVQGHTFLTNYDFIVDEKDCTQFSEKELKNVKYVQIMKAKDILKVLEKQNSII